MAGNKSGKENRSRKQQPQFLTTNRHKPEISWDQFYAISELEYEIHHVVDRESVTTGNNLDLNLDKSFPHQLTNTYGVRHVINFCIRFANLTSKPDQSNFTNPKFVPEHSPNAVVNHISPGSLVKNLTGFCQTLLIRKTQVEPAYKVFPIAKIEFRFVEHTESILHPVLARLVRII